MRPRDYLGGLVQLARLEDADERRALWRQSMATLAGAITSQRPVPLEGFSPEALQQSVRSAIDARLIDDLDFLSGPAAAAALYELAAALPVGRERRELGRRVLRRLHDGDAPTFVALATQIALSSRRALSGDGIRARVALALDMPIGFGARADALALALISRRDVEREWLTLPSTGSLPQRRLAARLLERAAREAARRAQQGDDSGIRVFEIDTVKAAWARLLGDRESLVWRHVATARGLLSESVTVLGDEVVRDTAPDLTPTEWRRAAASLAASIAIAPKAGLERARRLLESDVLERDRGVAGAMLLGVPRAAEAEPQAVEELLESLVRIGGLEATEALVDLRRERLGHEFGVWASERARAQLREMIGKGSSDDGRAALIESLHAELAADNERKGSATLPDRIGDALRAFAEKSAKAAYEEAREILAEAEATFGTLQLCRDHESTGRRHAFRALRELDVAMLEKSTLHDLLMLGSADEAKGGTQVLGDLFESLTQWIFAREKDPVTSAGAVDHLTHRLRRMRTLLHLVDAEGTYGEDKNGEQRRRRVRSAVLLLERVRHDAPSPLRRIVCAAASRACDALVREEMCEVSDVVIAAGTYIHSAQDLTTFAEASMVPEIETAVRAYAALEQVILTAPQSGQGERACLDALLAMAQALPVASSPRVEALRACLLRLVRELDQIASVASLTELAEGTEGTMLAPLESAVQTLAQLVAGARRRIGDREEVETPSVGASIRLLDFCVERALRGSRDALEDALESAADAMRDELPRLVGEAAIFALRRVNRLPADAPRRSRRSFMPTAPKEAPLPAWLPPSRILGGFYVLRTLGAGAVGSVFVARRAEERHKNTAPRFALKVPEYDGAAARTLSENEFLEVFRQEAGALLSVPAHQNLAGFVTFDAGARPKPILVMELVEGPTLERVIEMAELDVARAIDLLDGIAAGLDVMHGVGVGHLDVKPSNVILRDPDGLAGPELPGAPVLVDFGLAGRHIRPGCATGEYGAPEIWGGLGDPTKFEPMPADVYAFGAVAYEVLTRRTLFEAPSEMGLITAHCSHDGNLPAVTELAQKAETAPVADLIHHCLRRDPKARATIPAVRKRLKDLRRTLGRARWPLSA